jgi:hypothetical protein
MTPRPPSNRLADLEAEALETPGFDWAAALAAVEAELEVLHRVAAAIRELLARQGAHA